MAFNPNFVSTQAKLVKDDPMLRWSKSEDDQKYRSAFSKDRDRILYSKSFLRLRGKTQIFMLQKNDYIRTRMTHSLEVNQIAKTIASSLGLNLDLVEAIALGHDVGHTPFGHKGERTLADLIKKDKKISVSSKGFKHNLQALRLLCDLEKGADYLEHVGLNLTKYTLWGIAHHSSISPQQSLFLKSKHIKSTHRIYNVYLKEIERYWSFEGCVVALSDEIAQRHHDIEDGLSYGLIKRKDLLSQMQKFEKLFSSLEIETFNMLQNKIDQLEDPVFNSLFSRLVINMYVTDAIVTTKENLRKFEEKFNINKPRDFHNKRFSIKVDDYIRCVSLSPELSNIDEIFQTYLKNNILDSFQAQAMDGKAEYIIRKLYNAFCDTPSQLPDTSLFSFAHFLKFDNKINHNRETILKAVRGNEGLLHRCIVDYIGGMTDQFAYDEFDRLYGTKV